MELTNKRAVRSALESRTGVLIAAAVAAVLAGVLVFSAINSARDNVAVGSSTVLVANQLIPKGSTAEAISEGNLFKPASVAADSVVSGAVTDVSQLQGKVATADIYPGQQLSVSRFSAAGGAMATKLTARNRGISLPVDNAHGLIGDVRTGDRVDVYGGFNVQGSTGASSAVIKVLARDVVVLDAPKKTDASSNSSEEQIVLRANDRQAANFAFTGENGKVWVVLRPSSGARDSSVNIVTLRSLLAGVAPVAAPR